MQRWDAYTFVLLLHSGYARVSHGQHHVQLAPHDLVVTDSRSDFEISVDERCELTAFHIRRDLLSNVGVESFGRAIRGRQGLGMLLSRLLGSLLEAEDTLDDQDCILVSDSVARMIQRCLGASQCTDDSNARQRFARLRAWTLAHLDEPTLGPETLADAYGISRRQLYRLFETCGKTPAIWLKELRLHKAHLLLTLPDHESRSITEIAYAVGFSDAAHFSRAFRQRFGVSPSVVRTPSPHAGIAS